jgi:mannose-6-phosphate isomerase
MKSDATQIEGVCVIDARPGANIVSGTRVGNGLELFEGIANNTIEDSFRHLDVRAGDAFLIPPGAPHSLGDGILAYSITSPLLETSGVYDWGRYGELNIDKALDSFRYDYSISLCARERKDESREVLIESELFRLERVDATVPVEEYTDRYFCAYTALTQGRIRYTERTRNFAAGDTFLMPAGFGDYTILDGVLLKAQPESNPC